VAAVITFLFTDLVGSTELLERLGDDAAEGPEFQRTNPAWWLSPGCAI
jgi:hypothetical protein